MYIIRFSRQLYLMGIVDINPILWGCWLDFNPSSTGLEVYCYDAWPAGLCISHEAGPIEVNRILWWWESSSTI
jgi:hypothetical protein